MPELTNCEYHRLPQISNSTLSAFKRQLEGHPPLNCRHALDFGNLVDAMITETDLEVNEYMIKCDSLTAVDKSAAMQMTAVFHNDPRCSLIHEFSETQKIFFGRLSFQHDYLNVSFETRCKVDFYMEHNSTIVDLKTTAAKSQKAFNAACDYFDYDRQAAFYLDTTGADTFVLIGISKNKPYNIYFKTIKRGDSDYRSGKLKYMNLMVKYELLAQ